MNYLLFILAAVFVNNYILAQFLGICPFLGVSKKVETAAGMGVAVIFVMTLASAATYLIYNPLFRKEVFKKQGMRFGLKSESEGDKNA